VRHVPRAKRVRVGGVEVDVEVLDGDAERGSRIELDLHLVGEGRDDLHGIIARERDAGGLERRTRSGEIPHAERGVVERGPFRTCGGLRLVERDEDPGQLEELLRPAADDLRAEEVDPDLLMGRRVADHHMDVAGGDAGGVGSGELGPNGFRRDQGSDKQDQCEAGAAGHCLLL